MFLERFLQIIVVVAILSLGYVVVTGSPIPNPGIPDTKQPAVVRVPDTDRVVLVPPVVATVQPYATIELPPRATDRPADIVTELEVPTVTPLPPNTNGDFAPSADFEWLVVDGPELNTCVVVTFPDVHKQMACSAAGEQLSDATAQYVAWQISVGAIKPGVGAAHG